MKKSQRIKTIVDLKVAQEQDSLEALGVSQRKLMTLQTQVDGLKNYRQDYQEKFNRLGQGGTHVGQLMEFRSFMAKLDQAITGQEYSLDQGKADVANKRKIWERMHQRTQSLQKIYQSALKTEQKQESKAEQLEQDERASRLGKNNSDSFY
jgi:flagellar FliJ protein